MSYVAIWLQACLHWRCAYFQTLSWNDTIFVVDWDILYKLCGSANKWSKGFVFSGKIWWQFFSCNKACSKYHTRSTTTPKYTLTQRLVYLFIFHFWSQGRTGKKLWNIHPSCRKKKIGKSKIDADFQFLFWIENEMDEWPTDPSSTPSYFLDSIYMYCNGGWSVLLARIISTFSTSSRIPLQPRELILSCYH